MLVSEELVDNCKCCGPGYCDNCSETPPLHSLKHTKFDVVSEELHLCSVQINSWLIDFLKNLKKIFENHGNGVPEKLFNSLIKDAANDRIEKINKRMSNKGNDTQLPVFYNFLKGAYPYSLRSVLVRTLRAIKIFKYKYSNYHIGDDYNRFIDDLGKNKVKVWLKNTRLFETQKIAEIAKDQDEEMFEVQLVSRASQLKRQISCESLVMRLPKLRKLNGANICDVDAVRIEKKGQSNMRSDPIRECCFFNYPPNTKEWLPQLPFLYQFEICRIQKESPISEDQFEDLLRFIYKIDLDNVGRFKLCQFLHEFTNTAKSFSKYRKVVEAGDRCNLAVDQGYGSNAFGMGSALYFSANLDEDGKLKLLPGE